MLGNKFNGGAISHRIGLGQIFHRLDQDSLSIYVTRIGSALAPLPIEVGRNRDSENLGHYSLTFVSGAGEGLENSSTI